jgi:hypothetical protein
MEFRFGYGGFENWLVSLSNCSATAREFRFGYGGFENLSHRNGISFGSKFLAMKIPGA